MLLVGIPPSKTYPSGQSNVYGDANVIESILEVWANIVATTVQHGGYNIMHTLLLQSPILVEYAGSEASGFACQNPATGSKPRLPLPALGAFIILIGGYHHRRYSHLERHQPPTCHKTQE